MNRITYILKQDESVQDDNIDHVDLKLMGIALHVLHADLLKL